jgi:hypothetical protein
MNFLNSALMAIAMTTSVALIQPVQAQESEAAEEGGSLDPTSCVSDIIEDELRGRVAADMMNTDLPGLSDETKSEFSIATMLCGALYNLDDAQQEQYDQMSAIFTSRVWLAGDLERMGISPQLVDDTMGFGPGRANPNMVDGMPEADLKRLITAITESGFDLSSAPQEAVRELSYYVTFSSVYWGVVGE